MALILSNSSKPRKSEYIFGSGAAGGRCNGKLVLSADDLDGFSQITVSLVSASTDTIYAIYVTPDSYIFTSSPTITVDVPTNIPSFTDFLMITAVGNAGETTTEPGLIVKVTLS